MAKCIKDTRIDQHPHDPFRFLGGDHTGKFEVHPSSSGTWQTEGYAKKRGQFDSKASKQIKILLQIYIQTDKPSNNVIKEFFLMKASATA